jgi:hypothetical protein
MLSTDGPETWLDVGSDEPLVSAAVAVLSTATSADGEGSGLMAVCHLGLQVTAQLQQIFPLPESTRLLVISLGLATRCPFVLSTDMFDPTEADRLLRSPSWVPFIVDVRR